MLEFDETSLDDVLSDAVGIVGDAGFHATAVGRLLVGPLRGRTVYQFGIKLVDGFDWQHARPLMSEKDLRHVLLDSKLTPQNRLEQLPHLTAAELKTLLEFNYHIDLTHTKTDLEHIVKYIHEGIPPFCPQCGLTRLVATVCPDCHFVSQHKVHFLPWRWPNDNGQAKKDEGFESDADSVPELDYGKRVLIIDSKDLSLLAPLVDDSLQLIVLLNPFTPSKRREHDLPLLFHKALQTLIVDSFAVQCPVVAEIAAVAGLREPMNFLCQPAKALLRACSRGDAVVLKLRVPTGLEALLEQPHKRVAWLDLE